MLSLRLKLAVGNLFFLVVNPVRIAAANDGAVKCQRPGQICFGANSQAHHERQTLVSATWG